MIIQSALGWSKTKSGSQSANNAHDDPEHGSICEDTGSAPALELGQATT